jgi:hypothetical protein
MDRVVADHPYYAVTDAEGGSLLAERAAGRLPVGRVARETLGEMTKVGLRGGRRDIHRGREMVPR